MSNLGTCCQHLTWRESPRKKMQTSKGIIICFLSLFFSFATSDAIAHEVPSSIVVHMKQGGYDPKDVTIPKGITILFENSDTVDVWPASNIHPTHEIYSEFDPKRPIKRGEAWSFTFTKVGRWNYHDHVFPTTTGTITVTESDNATSGSFSSKKTTLSPKEQVDVFLRKLYYQIAPKKKEKKLIELNMHTIADDEKQLRYWLSVFGGETVMEELIKDSGGGSLVDCHQEAHQTGRIAYELFGANVFQNNKTECHSGYIHGAMEAFLKEKGTGDLASNVTRLCDEFKTHFGNFECLHGVGHGVIAYENYDLPKALGQCKSLSGWFAQRSCYGGTFMENIVVAQGEGAIQGHKTNWVSKDPQFPCNAVDQDYPLQFECYMMQTSWMLALNQFDFDKVTLECLKAREDMIPVCFKSFGRDAAGHVLRDQQKTLTLCEIVPKENDYYDQCIAGALNVLVDFWGEKLENQATDLCKIVPSENKEKCYSLLATRIKEIFTDPLDITRICLGFEQNYTHLCQSNV